MKGRLFSYSLRRNPDHSWKTISGILNFNLLDGTQKMVCINIKILKNGYEIDIFLFLLMSGILRHDNKIPMIPFCNFCISFQQGGDVRKRIVRSRKEKDVMFP